MLHGLTHSIPTFLSSDLFTVSNLGMFGIDEFTAIINAPDSCILAIGGIDQVPIVKNGQIVPGHIMKVTLTCAQRVVDGATGAARSEEHTAELQSLIRISYDVLCLKNKIEPLCHVL